MQLGETLGNYRIILQLGEGGMGVVYAAEHGLLKRTAAVKVLRPEHSQSKETGRARSGSARARCSRAAGSRSISSRPQPTTATRTRSSSSRSASPSRAPSAPRSGSSRVHATGPLALVLALSGCAAIDAFSGDGHGPDATSVPCTIEPALGAIDSASLTGQAATANGHASTQPGGASPTDDADADAFLPVWRLMFGVD